MMVAAGDDQPLQPHAEEEGLGEDALAPGTGLVVHDPVVVGLQPQGDGGEGVGEQVDKQQVDGGEGHRQGHKGGVEHREDAGGVSRQEELDGPA